MRVFFSSCLLLLAGYVFVPALKAQYVASYPFSTTTQPYTNLLVGNTVFSGTWGTADAQKIPIGFPFLYGGFVFDTMTVNPNGAITFGSGIASTASTPLSSTANTISLFGADLANSDATLSNVLVRTAGTIGNRVCTIGFQDFALVADATNSGNAQIRLYEADGRVELHYGVFETGFLAASPQVGLRGATDFHNLTGTDWAAPSSGTLVTDAMGITGAQVPDNGRQYTFSLPAGSVPTVPVSLNFSGMSYTSLTIEWADVSTDEQSFAIFSSTDGSNFNFIKNIYSTSIAGTGSLYSQIINDLAIGTQYFFRIYAVNESGYSTSALAGDATTLSGSFPTIVTLGCSGDPYPTLTAAIADAAVQGLSGPTLIEFQADYGGCGSETYPLVIPAIPGNSTQTLTIRPASGVSGIVFTSAAAQTLVLSAAENVILDGQPGGTGGTRAWTIANTSTSGNALKLENGAQHNRMQYLDLAGVTTGTTNGVVYIGSTSGATGNSFNSLTNSLLRDGVTTPAVMVYALGNAAALNESDTLSNCEIRNCWSNTTDSYGVLVGENNNAFVLTNNSLCQTATRNTATVSPNTHTMISVNNMVNGNTFIVSDNYLGGSAALAGGSAMQIGGSTTVVQRFQGISVAVGSSDGLTTVFINNNTLQNLLVNSAKSTGGGTAGTLFRGIGYTQSGGNGAITLNGNSIGSGSAAGNIALSTAKGNADCQGIYYYTDLSTLAAGTISSNVVGGISLTSGATTASGFCGIQVEGGYTAITGNAIGSTTVAHSIRNQTNSTAPGGNNNTYGINVQPVVALAATSFNNNIVANLTSDNTHASARLRGISAFSSVPMLSAPAAATGNRLFGLSAATTNTATDAIAGLYLNNSLSPAMAVTGNVVYDLRATSTTAATHPVGVWIDSDGSQLLTVSRNIIHSLDNQSSHSSAAISGMMVQAEKSTISNNIIRLGTDLNGSNLSRSNLLLYGLADNNTASVQEMAVAFNTLCIGGSNGNALSATLLRGSALTDVLALRGNIFCNLRTGSSSQHALLRLGNVASLTADYNLYYAPGSTAPWLTTDVTASYATLSDWQTASSQDAASLNSDPLLVAASAAWDTGANGNLKLTAGSPAESGAVYEMTISTDFENELRGGLSLLLTDIGADEGDYCNDYHVFTWTGLGNTALWDDPLNWDHTCDVPGPGDDVVIPAGTTKLPTGIPGGTLANLRLREAGTYPLTGDLTLAGTLELTAGHLQLGTSNLILASTASISGGSPASLVVTNGSGGMTWQGLGSGGIAGAVVFPVGPTAALYTPATMLNAGTQDNYTIRTEDGVRANGTSGLAIGNEAVDCTWTISEELVGGSDVTLTLQWDAAQELPGFDRMICAITHHDGSSWQPYSVPVSATGSGPYTLTYSQISAFSPVAVFSDPGVLPIENPVTFYGIGQNGQILLYWQNPDALVAKGGEIRVLRLAQNTLTEWQEIGVQAGQHLLEGAFCDMAPFPGNNIYQLEFTHADGSVVLTKPLEIWAAPTALPLISVSASNEYLKIIQSPPASGPIELRIIAVDGREVWHGLLHAGETPFRLPLGTFAPGTYVLEAVASEGEERYRFLKY